MLYTVSGLNDEARGISIRVRIISKHPPRYVKTRDGKEHKVVEAEVGDRTGMVILTLWDEQADKVNEGDVVDIKNGYVSSFRGQLRLNIGKYGEITKVQAPDFPTIERIRQTRFKRRKKWWGKKKK